MEQYFIARGAAIHKLPEISEVTLRTVDALEELGFVELYYWEEGAGLAGPGSQEGCDTPLWSTTVPAVLVAILRVADD